MKSTISQSPTRRSSRWTLTRAALVLTATGTLGAPMFSALPAQAQYGAPIGVIVNGRQINVGSVAPIREGGRVLVPLRGVLESLGANVSFDYSTSTVRAQRGATTIALRLGSTQAYVNGQLRTLDVPARTVNGRTIVPLRFMSEALGATVQYNGSQNAVYITTRGGVNDGGMNNGGVIDDGTIYNPPTDNAGNEIVLRGTVTNDPAGARRFEIRTNAGDVVSVRTVDAQPQGLNIGDRVELRGRYNGNVFSAQEVTILRDTAQETTLSGIVISIISNRRLTLRSNGQIYTVNVIDGIPSTIREDVSIRARGTLNGNVLQRATVTFNGGVIDDNLNNDGVNDDFVRENQSINWIATVVSRDIDGNTLRVRASNDTIYRVNYNRPDDFNVGDSVRVRGVYSNGAVEADSVIAY